MFSEGYIGFTSKSVDHRWVQHTADAKRHTHLPIYKALAKYGDRLVVTTVIEGSTDYCLDIENRLRPQPRIGWNIKIGGDFGSLGVHPSEETRQKMSVSRQGEMNYFYGRTHSDEQKAKWSESRRGTEVSQETRARQSAVRTGKKLNLTAEQRLARSQRAKSRIASDETRAKISASRIGKYVAWLSPNASPLWGNADAICKYMIDNPTHGLRKLAEQFSCTTNQIKTISKKIKDGWIPLEDANWLLFTQELETIKEAECLQHTAS